MLQHVLPDVLYLYGKMVHPWLLYRIWLVSFRPFVWWAAMPVGQPDSIYPTFGGGSSFQAATGRSLSAAAPTVSSEAERVHATRGIDMRRRIENMLLRTRRV